MRSTGSWPGAGATSRPGRSAEAGARPRLLYSRARAPRIRDMTDSLHTVNVASSELLPTPQQIKDEFGIHPGEADLEQGFSKQIFVGVWGAGGNQHAVDILFLDDFRHMYLGVLGARKEVVLYMHHIWQSSGVFSNRGHVHNAANIDAAVANEHPDSGLVFTDVPLLWQLLDFGLGPTTLAE